MFSRPSKPQPLVIRDTREQKPYDFPNYATIDRKLEFGDYALEGFENVLPVERKTFADYVATVTAQHDRFWRELARAREVGARLVVIVEGEYWWIKDRQYRGEIHPNAILGATAALIAEGTPVHFVGDRENGRDACELLFKRVWDLQRESRLQELQR
jgi:ERCC4-type nuclease